MTKILMAVLVVIILLVSGCGYNAGVSINANQAQSRDYFGLVYLFTVDGVKIYRFWDCGHFHYIAIGNGRVLNTVQSSGGKTQTTWEDSTVDGEVK